MLKPCKLHQYNNICSDFLLVISITFLLALSITSALVRVTISTTYVLLIQVIVSIIMSHVVLQKIRYQIVKIVKILSIFSIHTLLPSLIIVYYIFFHISYDTEWYYIKIILYYKHTNKLIEIGEPLYYALFPVPQIIGSTFNLISMLPLKWLYVLIFVILYEAFILTVYTVLKKLGFCAKYNYLLLTLISIYYLHRPFKDLMQGAFGIYAVSLSMLILVLMFLEKGDQRRPLLLTALAVSLYIAHAIAIYFTALMLLLIAIIMFTLIKDARNLKKIFLLSIVIFSSTYAFQISSGLIANLIYELKVRPWQIINSIMTRGLERPLEGVSIIEQQKHFIYSYHIFTVPLAYGFPIVICLLAIAELIRSLHKVSTSLTKLALTMVITSIFYSFTLIGIALLFAYYGIENYIARYLYYYASPFYLLTFSFVYYFSRGVLKRLLEIGLLVQFICWITEPLYAPWFSLYYLYDVHQMKIVLAGNMFDHIYNNILSDLVINSNIKYFIKYFIFNSFAKTAISSYIHENCVFYNNNFFILFIHLTN